MLKFLQLLDLNHKIVVKLRSETYEFLFHYPTFLRKSYGVGRRDKMCLWSEAKKILHSQAHWYWYYLGLGSVVLPME